MFRAVCSFRFNTPAVTKLVAPCALLSLLITPAFADDKTTAADGGLLPLEELRTFTRVYDHVRNGYVD